jgi:hypothetical protein
MYAYYLRQILDVTDLTRYSGNGTVRNSAELGGLPPSTFQRNIVDDIMCDPGEYMIGINVDGSLICGTPNAYCAPTISINNATFRYGATSPNQPWVE